jgi:hypothetical protein
VTTSAERKALNQGTFREANERLEQVARDLIDADDASLVPFLCECPRRECMAVVLTTLAEYEQVRAVPEQGLARIGHEDPSIEHIVARNDRFLVTKKVGAAGEVHRETDPRQ